MTKRKPLEWFDAGTESFGVEGKIPACTTCCDLLFSALFIEGVSSVLIESKSGSSPADLARDTINDYHDRRHQG